MAVSKGATERLLRMAIEENGADCIFVKTLRKSASVPGMTVRKLQSAVASQKRLRNNLRAVGLLKPNS